MQAIICKYMPATYYRGARIKASCERGSIALPIDHGLHDEDMAAHAVEALCAKFDAEDRAKYGSEMGYWSLPKVCGQIPSGEWVFCFLPRTP